MLGKAEAKRFVCWSKINALSTFFYSGQIYGERQYVYFLIQFHDTFMVWKLQTEDSTKVAVVWILRNFSKEIFCRYVCETASEISRSWKPWNQCNKYVRGKNQIYYVFLLQRRFFAENVLNYNNFFLKKYQQGQKSSRSFYFKLIHINCKRNSVNLMASYQIQTFILQEGLIFLSCYIFQVSFQYLFQSGAIENLVY